MVTTWVASLAALVSVVDVVTVAEFVRAPRVALSTVTWKLKDVALFAATVPRLVMTTPLGVTPSGNASFTCTFSASLGPPLVTVIE